MGSGDQGSRRVSTGRSVGGEDDGAELGVVRRCEETRRSYMRTEPSYHPETTICSEGPRGEEGGAHVMPYTAEGRVFWDWRAIDGVGEIP